MIIIKKAFNDVKKEEAHGGSGSRKLYIDDNEFGKIQGMTYGWLPIGNKYEWHKHDNVDEVMYVVKGTGIIKDADGEYTYNTRDVFMFPANVFHEIYNNGDVESEYVFVRMHNDSMQNNR